MYETLELRKHRKEIVTKTKGGSDFQKQQPEHLNRRKQASKGGGGEQRTESDKLKDLARRDFGKIFFFKCKGWKLVENWSKKLEARCSRES